MDQPYVPKRVWREYLSDAWRTDFPPPPDYDGEERGAWEEQGYSRSLTAAELAALTVGNAIEEPVTLAHDEAERDAFFASLAAPLPPPSAGADTSPKTGGGADLSRPSPSQGEVSAQADGGAKWLNK